MSSGQHLKSKMEELGLVCCKVYISESRNEAALEAIERAGRSEERSGRRAAAALVSKRGDRAYNRFRYTLVSDAAADGGDALRNAVVAMVREALSAVDLEAHSGAHPRIGVVDHICFHPLARAALHHAARLANLVASDIGNAHQVPVFLYGAADSEGKELDEIRRKLGYYQSNLMGSKWAGWAQSMELPKHPDVGPVRVNPTRGITIIGASPWVEHYNIPVRSSNVSAVRRIARLVSARGGGLQAVQALGLLRDDDTTEVACILLEPNRVGADRVQSRVQELAAQEGLRVDDGYFTDISLEMILDRYLKMSCDNTPATLDVKSMCNNRDVL